MNTFGERFKSIRLSKKLTQQQIANEFNRRYGYAFTKTTISQYENNKRVPEMNAVRNFVKYFNVSLDYLLCNDIHVVKELGQKYNMLNDSEFIELEKIATLIKNLAEDGRILLNNIEISARQRQTLLNGIDIICGLVKRETEKE
ncbi:helix-turn-helix domain-containing protein [Clostridium estertheticum]|uniref:helix-turn-helix domain-containing protein n=1 Tax=Clostridium estertheticum TaxID=238834 RepID=UPI001CF0EB03|nr:helix-turn-helix transcriptional regulator [Clostridium estertheticum]MCB2308726.1 helix-turn-helix domain-containing protein [Clostridium estertheticum]MCB2347455.1 helix-turn-helix domain-containing protein [Clostridium estertheticum]MCB2351720.1 helix-turn-helix domain-containing protein [Clostridium estertheticum]WAG46299.1 helix-turn-helix domain-containing protein [Clostridium estertheticum]